MRRASFQSRRLALPHHVEWFRDKVNDPSCRLWVAEKNGAVAGFVRIDKRRAGQGEISIALDAASRGGGWGRTLIRRAVLLGARQMKLERVLASIKFKNASSQRAFEAADFKPLKKRAQADRLVLAWRKGTKTCSRSSTMGWETCSPW